MKEYTLHLTSMTCYLDNWEDFEPDGIEDGDTCLHIEGYIEDLKYLAEIQNSPSVVFNILVHGILIMKTTVMQDQLQYPEMYRLEMHICIENKSGMPIHVNKIQVGEK